jgi:hypothetical protein
MQMRSSIVPSRSAPHGLRYHHSSQLVTRHREITQNADRKPGAPIIPGLRTSQSYLISSDNTGSDDTISFILRSIARCQTFHGRACRRSIQTDMTTTRLLKLSDDNRVRLVQLYSSSKADYVCLAHRWPTKDSSECSGDSTPYIIPSQCQTLTSNLAQRKNYFGVEDLLPAYRNTISVVKRLGLRYVWIDSLCIVQDDENDVRTQIAQMGSIYGNSYLTIAADSGKDHTQSFFSLRKWRWRAQEQVVTDVCGSKHTVYIRERPNHSRLGWDGLFKRAWYVKTVLHDLLRLL